MVRYLRANRGRTVTWAVNDEPISVRVGQRPYEMANRPPLHQPLVDFEDLRGWRVICRQGAEASFIRSREQQMEGRYVGKIVYRGVSRDSHVELKPRQALPIPTGFTAAELWVYGNNWFGEDVSTPPVDIVLRLRDGQNQVHEIGLGSVSWKEWHLMHWSVGYPPREAMSAPVRMESLKIYGCANTQWRTLFFDSLAFFREQRGLLHLPPIPQSCPFPTRPDTIRPTCSQGEETRGRSGSTYWWRYRGASGTLQYEYTPRTGTFGDIVAVVEGRTRFQPLAGGGLWVTCGGRELPPEDPGWQRQLLEQRETNGRVYTRWWWTHPGIHVEFTLRLQLSGRTLILEIDEASGQVTALSLGAARGLRQPRVLYVPYLTLGGSAPGILVTDGFFASCFVDWYVTRASQMYGVEAQPSTSEGVVYNGGTRYLARTDGARNPLHERIFLTVSPRFEEVLPHIPNPPSPMGPVMRRRLFTQQWSLAHGYAQELQKWRRYKRYGLEQVLVRFHEDVWRDGGEGFTLRTEAAPKKGGDSALRNFIRELRALGYRVGLYVAWEGVASVGERFREEDVLVDPQGQWISWWPRIWEIKRGRAYDWQRQLAPVIYRKFGNDAVYSDCITARPPPPDYEAGCPGAGQLNATYRYLASILLHERSACQGPVFSEGGMHWIYAGLADGNYAQTNVPLSPENELLVDFDLLKLHPLEMDVGMGWLNGPPDEQKLDRFLAQTIAYGHLGYLLTPDWPLPAIAKSYYVMQQIQERYLLVPVADIRYYDGQRWLDSSAAIRTGAIAHRQVQVRYRNGLHVYVNHHPQEAWEVRCGGETYSLPPDGFLVWRREKPRDFVAFSALVNEHRMDWVQSPRYTYLDTRGQRTAFRGIEARGSWVMRPRQPSSLSILRFAGPPEIRVALPREKEWRRTNQVRVVGWDEVEHLCSERIVQVDPDGMVALAGPESVVEYRMFPVRTEGRKVP